MQNTQPFIKVKHFYSELKIEEIHNHLEIKNSETRWLLIQKTKHCVLNGREVLTTEDQGVKSIL